MTLRIAFELSYGFSPRTHSLRNMLAIRVISSGNANTSVSLVSSFAAYALIKPLGLKNLPAIRGISSGKTKTGVSLIAGYAAYALTKPMVNSALIAALAGLASFKFMQKYLDKLYPFPAHQKSEGIFSILLQTVLDSKATDRVSIHQRACREISDYISENNLLANNLNVTSGEQVRFTSPHSFAHVDGYSKLAFFIIGKGVRANVEATSQGNDLKSCIIQDSFGGYWKIDSFDSRRPNGPNEEMKEADFRELP